MRLLDAVIIIFLIVSCSPKDSGMPELQQVTMAASDIANVKHQLRTLAQEDDSIRVEFDAVFGNRTKTPEAAEKFKMVYMRMRELDVAHHKTLNNFVDKYGWINPERFGEQASRDAWLITQHMVHDGGDFQKQMLSIMAPGVNVSGTQYALLSDRIAVIFDKQPQEYGTQGKCQKNGNWQVSAVRDFGSIDARRLSLGFETFAQYESKMDAKCATRINK
jgi:Family of unknown function (DUF6624)